MSGKASRAARVEAVNRAREEVYRNKGIEYEDVDNPFSNPRQARIFEKYYRQFSSRYWWCLKEFGF